MYHSFIFDIPTCHLPCLSVYLSVCLSICLSVYPSVCLALVITDVAPTCCQSCLSICLYAQPWHQRGFAPNSLRKGTCSTGLETGCKPVLLIHKLAFPTDHNFRSLSNKLNPLTAIGSSLTLPSLKRDSQYFFLAAFQQSINLCLLLKYW